ncbi:uncharacterized protein LOC144357549 [Saccoglossus kowalevskii]
MKLVLLFVLGMVCHSLALKCYTCTTLLDLNPDCQTDFADTGISCDIYDFDNPTCTVSNTMSDGKVTLFSRACLERSMCVIGEGCSYTQGLKICNSCCDTDLCNSGNINGNSIGQSTTIIGTLVLMYFIL